MSIAPDLRAACIIAFMPTLAPVLLVLAVLACSSSSKVEDPVVARIGAVAITVHELQAWAAARPQSEKGASAKGESDVERWRSLLNALLRDEAVLQEGRRRGYDRDPAVRG
jgi:hypothetical protein